MKAQWLPITAALILTATSGMAQPTSANPDDEHIVSREELHEMTADITVQRQENEEKVKAFFATEMATSVLDKMHLNGTRIDQALGKLSNDELERLAQQADEAKTKFAGGALNNQQITYILIALATAVIVLILT